MLASGSHGAELWVSGSGERLIVKRHPTSSRVDLEVVVARVDTLRRAGVPVPVTSVSEADGDAVLLQAFVAGRSATEWRLNLDLVDHLLGLVERQSGLADASASEWTDLMTTSLVIGLPGYCEHESLRQLSKSSCELLDRIESVGRDPVTATLSATDLVHYDLNPTNVLSADGHQVTAIIDWDGVRAGDLAFDLGVLAFASSWADIEPAALDRIVGRIPRHVDPRRAGGLHAPCLPALCRLDHSSRSAADRRRALIFAPATTSTACRRVSRSWARRSA